MLAGYETTSTTLTYCSFVLAKHPDEQQKLYDEISSVFGTSDDIKVKIFVLKNGIDIYFIYVLTIKERFIKFRIN